MPKCPHCDKQFNYGLKLHEAHALKDHNPDNPHGVNNPWDVVVYSCPNCDAVLQVAMHPDEIQKRLIGAITKGIIAARE